MTSAPPTGLALSSITTFGVGGSAASHTTVTDDASLIQAVRENDAAGQPVLLVGGGSNLLIGDGPVAQHVIVVRSTGTEHTIDADTVTVTAQAGCVWDDLVAHTVRNGWAGIEALSGIPGSVGATPIQNVGAYGQDVSQTITSVRVWDRHSNVEHVLGREACEFGYRDSLFKRTPGRYVVISVTFELSVAATGPIAYKQVADAMGKDLGALADIADIRTKVLSLRANKGMVLDIDDHDTWSAGSFFTNPIVAEGLVPHGAPAFDAGVAGKVKTSAAWLIEHAGFAKGYGLPGPASLSTKHTLALTNRGNATAADILALAATVRDGVRDCYGITLVPEPNLVNCTL